MTDRVEMFDDFLRNLRVKADDEVAKNDFAQTAIMLELRNTFAVTLEVGEEVASLLEILDRIGQLRLAPGTRIEDFSAIMLDEVVDHLGCAVRVGRKLVRVQKKQDLVRVDGHRVTPCSDLFH